MGKGTGESDRGTAARQGWFETRRSQLGKGGQAVKNSIGRLVFVGIAVLLQIAWILILFIRLNAYSSVISLCTSVLSVVVIIVLYNRQENASFRMAWMVLVAIAPIFGLTLFALVEGSSALSSQRRHKAVVDRALSEVPAPDDSRAVRGLRGLDRAYANQFAYLRDVGRSPVDEAGDGDVTFYAEATDALEAQKEDLRRARSSIFMEYHAVEDAEAFAGIHEILVERAAAGVDVRMLYDDMGSFGFINRDFIERMEADGIRCRAFNPMVPLINVFMDNRDHRKITVIDGAVSYTGGFNLADEYFNITHPYGYWKDTGIRVTGEAAWSFTRMFLQLWHTSDRLKGPRATRRARSEEILRADCERYLGLEGPAAPAPAAGAAGSPDAAGPRSAAADEQEPAAGAGDVRESRRDAPRHGFVQPYGVDPFSPVRLGEDAYLNAIKSARDYVWFVTPYLIITDDMLRELCLAAARGVDVRICTPGIPDKRLVYSITRSYYRPLASAGVRVFEYTPGFNHSKQVLVDGRVAIVGTINLDFRSLYHHFENGVLMCDVPALRDIRADFDQVMSVSREVTEESLRPARMPYRLMMGLLRLFVPLL